MQFRWALQIQHEIKFTTWTTTHTHTHRHTHTHALPSDGCPDNTWPWVYACVCVFVCVCVCVYCVLQDLTHSLRGFAVCVYMFTRCGALSPWFIFGLRVWRVAPSRTHDSVQWQFGSYTDMILYLLTMCVCVCVRALVLVCVHTHVTRLHIFACYVYRPTLPFWIIEYFQQ